MELLVGKALVNIVRVDVTTEEDTPETFSFDTSSDAQVEPEISEGNKNVLRIKNKIVAIDRTEDIVIGYNTTLTENVLHPEVFALIDGGTLTYDDVDTDKVTAYDAPVSGQTVSRTKFTMDIYTAEKDSSGEILGYAKFSFKHCKGKPVGYNIVDGEFQVPEMTMESRPANGESPVKIEFLDTLPTV